VITVAEARMRILGALTPLSAERIPLANALGRVLAEAPRARWSQPSHDLSAMDGYAVRSADIPSVPLALARGETIQAGIVPKRALAPGEAARIFTGAPVPREADAIVIQEDTKSLDDGRIEILEAPRKGQHIRRAGLDFTTGDALRPPGTLLTARDLALLAAAGIGEVTVHRRPVVAVIATGDELVPPGETPQGAQIVASSAVGLAAQIEAHGGAACFIGIARDTAESLRAQIGKARDADMIVTLGGASVGEFDLIREVLGGEGLALDFWKIAMRPGKPLMFGALGATPFLGLPGNPVSSLVCALLFLVPALKKMQGMAETEPPLIEARCTVALKPNGPREDYMRARLTFSNDGAPPAITPFPLQDSSMLSILAQADALLVRPIGAAAGEPGALVPALPLANGHILS
jgi:molybdopterin molybdotransferase